MQSNLIMSNVVQQSKSSSDAIQSSGKNNLSLAFSSVNLHKRTALHNSGSLVYICLHCLHSINSHPFDPLRLWFTILKIATWIALITLCLRVIKLTFSFRISIADFDPFDPFESICKISNFLFVLACQQIFNQLFKLKNSQFVNRKCN